MVSIFEINLKRYKDEYKVDNNVYKYRCHLYGLKVAMNKYSDDDSIAKLIEVVLDEVSRTKV